MKYFIDLLDGEFNVKFFKINWLYVLMNYSKYFYVVLMLFITMFFSLLFLIYDVDLILSYSVFLNLIISFFICYTFSPEEYTVKLSLVYLLGFSLFIGGRFIANIFGVDETFCFEFGYAYCLSYTEKFRTVLLVNLSLIFFCFGYLNNAVVKKIKFINDLKGDYKNNNLIKPKFFLILILALFSGGYVFFNTILSVQKSISGGYLSLYQGQIEAYTSPILLMITLFFNALVALFFAYKDSINKKTYYLILILFFSNLFLSVLAGGRAGFFTALLMLLWLYLGKNKISLIKILFLPFILFIMMSVNKIASLSGARLAETTNTLYEKIIIDIFYGQGITMMVFSLGSMRNDYPFLAYLKTIIPGSQIIASLFSDIYQYEISFSQYLMYKISPNAFYEGYGLGWSLLGDFYAFSFGFIIIFIIYNYIWGKIIFLISSLIDKNIFYNGLYFCFLSYLFIINRSSISPLLVLIGFYILLIFILKLKWKSYK